MKFARMVFEVEVDDDANEEEIVDVMERQLSNFIGDRWGIDDIEIHNRSYNLDTGKLRVIGYEIYVCGLGECTITEKGIDVYYVRETDNTTSWKLIPEESIGNQILLSAKVTVVDPNKSRLHEWTKRLGQKHFILDGEDETLCGKPLLGNNYSKVIHDNEKKECEKCIKEAGRRWELFNIQKGE